MAEQVNAKMKLFKIPWIKERRRKCSQKHVAERAKEGMAKMARRKKRALKSALS